MKKKHYIAVCCKKGFLQGAYVVTITGNINLIGLFDDAPGYVLSANICDSKADAWRIVNGWNDEFKRAGLYLF